MFADFTEKIAVGLLYRPTAYSL